MNLKVCDGFNDCDDDEDDCEIGWRSDGKFLMENSFWETCATVIANKVK